MNQEILGYTNEGEPIYPLKPGTMATAALIICSSCHKTIRSSGGPSHGAVCLDCWLAVPRPRALLKKRYSSEELADLSRDLHEAFDPRFTPQAAGIPKDEHGFDEGSFLVIVTWTPKSTP